MCIVYVCEFIVVLHAIKPSQIENILSRKFIYYTYPTKHNSSADPTSEVLRRFTLACSYHNMLTVSYHLLSTVMTVNMK